MKRIIHSAGFALIALVSSGCAGLWHQHDETPEEGGRKPAPANVSLIGSPKEMREDQTYPSGSVKQAAFWTGRESEWRFNLPGKGYAYAGFRFVHSHNFLNQLDKYELIFTIRPASRTRNLWAGLVDGDDAPPHLVVDQPLADYADNTAGNGRATVRIPLNRFPALGVPSEADAGYAATPAPFDWQDVIAFRLINPGGRMPAGDIVVTGLRIAR